MRQQKTDDSLSLFAGSDHGDLARQPPLTLPANQGELDGKTQDGKTREGEYEPQADPQPGIERGSLAQKCGRHHQEAHQGPHQKQPAGLEKMRRQPRKDVQVGELEYVGGQQDDEQNREHIVPGKIDTAKPDVIGYDRRQGDHREIADAQQAGNDRRRNLGSVRPCGHGRRHRSRIPAVVRYREDVIALCK